MSGLKPPSKQTLHALRALSNSQSAWLPRASVRTLSTSAAVQEEAQLQRETPKSFYRDIQPETVSSPRLERRLMRKGIKPIGSRRMRMALQNNSGIPFEQLPYQCFQEARKIILEDRQGKMKEIETMRQRIGRVKAIETQDPGAESRKEVRLRSMQLELEQLKIYADMNDPLVKKRFEDGQGDMGKPVYRFLANRKWHEYRRKVLMQRVTQMTVVPDILTSVDPTVDVRLFFNNRDIPPGLIVGSKISENAPRLTIQPFEQGEKVVTIAVIDPDVPNLEKDGFDFRCHFLASNITISTTSIVADLPNFSATDQTILPWLAPFSEKGLPYQRFATFIFQQKDNLPIDTEAAKPRLERHGFNLRSFADRHLLKPIGVHLFRSAWDEETAGVMRRAGFGEQADVQFKRKKVEPLQYKRRNPSTMR